MCVYLCVADQSNRLPRLLAQPRENREKAAGSPSFWSIKTPLDSAHYWGRDALGVCCRVHDLNSIPTHSTGSIYIRLQSVDFVFSKNPISVYQHLYSSRFTDSGKYQPHFGACFHLKEERSGDICNACVLLVKRFRKLPNGLQRHWGHVSFIFRFRFPTTTEVLSFFFLAVWQVVDARANTKVRPKLSIVAKPPPEDEDDGAVDDGDDDDDIKMVSKVVRKKRREKREEKRWNRSRSKLTTKIENQMPSFLDPKLWHRFFSIRL